MDSTITSTPTPQPVANNNNYRSYCPSNRDLKEALENLATDINKNFNDVNENFSSVKVDTTKISGKLDAIDKRVDSLETRVVKLEDSKPTPVTSNSTIDSMLPIALLLRLFG